MNIKVWDLIHYAADISNKPADAIIETATKLKLGGDDLKKNYLKLSGGMKQKLLIAIALGRGCDIIIMDEPTSNLDPDSRKIFYDLFLNCEKDKTLILTSHRSEELGFLVNRVVEDAALRDETTVLARRLADGPRIAYGYMKRNLFAAETEPLAAVLEMEAVHQARTAMTEDHLEASRAFAEKRRPVFGGR